MSHNDTARDALTAQVESARSSVRKRRVDLHVLITGAVLAFGLSITIAWIGFCGWAAFHLLKFVLGVLF
ncbi:hypothetical protein [Methylobacterium sp. ID0610]|uniref:hypothetical protein n=1 Tax=Methylobacterium carpenticola TaxID=3344827 RepID=UPI00368F0312